ncbi:MAG: hypothetical protein U0929_15885 [Planctomycetaceae bacterium]
MTLLVLGQCDWQAPVLVVQSFGPLYELGRDSGLAEQQSVFPALPMGLVRVLMQTVEVPTDVQPPVSGVELAEARCGKTIVVRWQ